MELAFFAIELAFFTTEHTENCLRATEEYNCYFLGVLRAPRNDLCGALSLPKYLSYSVALRFSSVRSVVKKASFVR